MHLNHVRSKHGLAIGSVHLTHCPHCGSPPEWVRLLALAGLLLAMAPWLAAAPPGMLNDWPHKWATVSVTAAAITVLVACFKTSRKPLAMRSE